MAEFYNCNTQSESRVITLIKEAYISFKDDNYEMLDLDVYREWAYEI